LAPPLSEWGHIKCYLRNGSITSVEIILPQ
jgi:hypothetical protein